MKKRNVITLAAGILIGIGLSCPLAGAAEVWFKATPSTQTFHVDGQAVELDAYSINDNNYVKLRDIGRLVDFNVAFDPVRNAAVIRTDMSYTGVNTACLANGRPATEENVIALLHEIQTDWPAGTAWGKYDLPGTNRNNVPSTASNKVMDHYNLSSIYACGGYAAMVSSLIFGDDINPARKLDNVSQLRPGDIVVQVRDNGGVSHVMIALESPNEEGRLHTTDGNAAGRVRWPADDGMDPRIYSISGGANSHIEVWTRYPEGSAPTGGSVGEWKRE